jgi:hypothetical protein
MRQIPIFKTARKVGWVAFRKAYFLFLRMERFGWSPGAAHPVSMHNVITHTPAFEKVTETDSAASPPENDFATDAEERHRFT